MNEQSALTAEPRGRLSEIQLMRAIAMVGVVLIHATSFATVQMKASSVYWIYHVLNVSMAFATPTFIFLSGFVLFYNYYDKPLTRRTLGHFYRKRLVYVIVPYVLFSIIYYVLYHYAYEPGLPAAETIHDFFVRLATGRAYTHLYFVFIIAQFYLLFPLLLSLLQRFPATIGWAVPVGLAIQWAFFLWNDASLQLPNLKSWAPAYASQYLIGAVLGIYYPKLRTWLNVSRQHATPGRAAAWMLALLAWLAAGAAMLAIHYDIRMHKAEYSPLLTDALWTAYSITSAVMLLLLSPALSRRLPSLLRIPLDSIAAYSFGIYLFHPLVLFLYRQHQPGDASAYLHVWYAGGFAAALGSAWLITALAARFVPGSTLLFGELPKRR
ncbi:acyltransferase [Paenibacillus kobensis]|uniref:acyltransferase n=1 Tax=Paenibacillus kobensis TaxID=59841 RepID=UPI0013E357A7|nr:acyltransferase [Paenibacillus kobensis]